MDQKDYFDIEIALGSLTDEASYLQELEKAFKMTGNPEVAGRLRESISGIRILRDTISKLVTKYNPANK
jgi:hypothetical protein